MPAFIPWSDAFEIGVPAIDREHRELTELLNRVAALNAAGNAIHDDLLELLGHLYQHTQVHFRHEEELMSAIGFDDYLNHRAEHQMLLAELRSFVQQIEQGDALLDTKSLHALKDWLLVHMASSDRPFADAYLTAAAANDEFIPR